MAGAASVPAASPAPAFFKNERLSIHLSSNLAVPPTCLDTATVAKRPAHSAARLLCKACFSSSCFLLLVATSGINEVVECVLGDAEPQIFILAESLPRLVDLLEFRVLGGDFVI